VPVGHETDIALRNAVGSIDRIVFCRLRGIVVEM
jgi:hypothetical protein